MSFLDRFKPQPRWKHADAAVRAAAVPEIPDDEEHDAVIVELALEDEDVRVRRAAAGRLSSPVDLVRLVRSETDADLRREVSERLVAIASAPAASDGDAALALEGLDDRRQLAMVARQSPHDTVRTAALGRVHDVKALGSVARNAAHGQTAFEAVARIADRAELLAVALKTEHKEAGIAALERTVELTEPGELREMLDTVGTRARNKSVGKKARSMMQAMEEAETARRIALETWQQQVAGLVARVEALASASGSGHAARELAEAEAEWTSLASGEAFELDADTAARFTSAAERARAAVAEHQRVEAERRAVEAERAARRDRQSEIADRLDACRGDDLLDQVASARAEWEGLASDDDSPEAAAARARFEDACARAERRHQNRLDREQTIARLTALADEMARLSGSEPLDTAAWDTATAEWTALRGRVEDGELDEAIEQKYQEAAGRVRQRADERAAAAERSRRQHVARVEQLIERAEKRSAAEDLTLREADRLVRDLRAALEALPPVDEREQHALAERLKAATAVVGPKLHDLREMDEWKRFANAAVQEELIARAEALRVKYFAPAAATPPAAEPAAAVAPGAEPGTEPAAPDAAQASEADAPAPAQVKDEDLEHAARELHDIQERWKTVAEAPRAQAQALWHRYRQAADPVQSRLREFFAQRNEDRKRNLDLKLALIARAEALADSTDWIKTADELKKLQAEWQQIGPAPRQDTKATWKRFRDACDRFFTRRNVDLAERKETWSSNLAKKEALCVRAEELAASKDWERAASEIRRLQVDWKAIGPVRRNKSDAIWGRFRTACDTFFDRYKRRDEIELESKQADREALVAELEALAPAEGTAVAEGGDAATLLEQVRSLRSRWNQSTPVVRQGADPLSARFVARARADAGGAPRRVPRHRARHRAEPAEDGEADRARRGLPGRCRAAAVEFLAGARRHAARSPCLQHDWRPGRRREQVADDGGGGASGAGVVEPARPGAWRGGPRAERALPPRHQPLLRHVSPQGAAAAAGAPRGAHGRQPLRPAAPYCARYRIFPPTMV